MGDLASWVGIVIAAGSLVVAIVALRRSGRAAAEANAVQRQLVAIEEQRESERRAQAQKAALRPTLRKTGTSGYRLFVENSGSSAAQNVRVALGGKPLCEHPAAVRNDSLPSLIAPESEVSCLMAFSSSTPHPPFETEIAWEDGSGQPGSYSGTLTF